MELTARASGLLVLTLLTFLIGASSIPLFINRTGSNMEKATSFYDQNIQDINATVRGKQFPVITAKNQRIKLNETFDPKTWVKVTDPQDGTITNRVEVFGTINNKKKGDYEIRYSVRNSYGLKTEKKIRVIVD